MRLVLLKNDYLCTKEREIIVLESQIENSFIQKLTTDLKYVYRDDIHDRQSLERNFREKFQNLNRVHLTDAEFTRLMDEIHQLRMNTRNSFQRYDVILLINGLPVVQIELKTFGLGSARPHPQGNRTDERPRPAAETPCARAVDFGTEDV